MRTSRVPALVCGLVLAILAVPPAPAMGTTIDPVLAAGRVLDGDGRPVPGPVEVRAWPTGLPLSTGEVVTPALVATGSANRAGAFILHAAATPELLRLAEANNGYVNFVLYTPNGGEWHFSRYVGGLPDVLRSRSQLSLEALRWSERPELAAEPLEVRLPAEYRAAMADGYTPQHFCKDYEVVSTRRADTKVGEIHAEGDTVQNTFVYGEGKTADSDISVAVRGLKGGWQLAGTHHIGTQKMAKAGHIGGRWESLWFSSGFDYHLVRDGCGREKVVVHQWRGGLEHHRQTNQGCTIEPYQRHAESYGAGDFFERSENRAMTWSNAANVFGASLTAKSGFSKEVHMKLKFGSAPVHLVCGDDEVAPKSKRVFSGQSSPI